MRTVVMSSESRDIPLRNLYPNATGFLDFARNDRVVIPSDSEGSLASRSENREMFRSLNMTRFAIPRSTLPFCHVEICRAGVSPADFKNGNRERLPYNVSAPPYRSHFFRHIDAEQFQATLQDAPGQIAQRQPR